MQPPPPRRVASVRRQEDRDLISRHRLIEDTGTYVLNDGTVGFRYTEVDVSEAAHWAAANRAGWRRILREFPTLTEHLAKKAAAYVDENRRPRLKRIHPSAAIPHGTVGGATNWRCQCLWVPWTSPRWWDDGQVIPLVDVATFPIPGCERAVTEATRAHREKSKAEAPTRPLQIVGPERHTGVPRPAQPDHYTVPLHPPAVIPTQAAVRKAPTNATRPAHRVPDQGTPVGRHRLLD